MQPCSEMGGLVSEICLCDIAGELWKDERQNEVLEEHKKTMKGYLDGKRHVMSIGLKS